MDFMTEIAQFINSVGFPIVACVFMYKQQVKLQETITELSATLKSIDTRLDMLENNNGGVKNENCY